MRPRRCLIGGVLALCVVGAVPPAQAQSDKDPARSARAIVVADGAVKLQVADEGASLCLGIEADGGSSESCDAAESGEAVSGRTARGTRFVGVAVPAVAATVEVRRAGQILTVAPTVAGEAYTGRRARTLRFALVRLPSAARDDGLRVRAFAANGGLVAVLAVSGSRELISDRHRLLSGRSGAVRWTVVSRQESTLAVSVLDPAHETISHCVEVRVAAPHEASSSDTCVNLTPRESLTLLGGSLAQASVADRCRPDFRLIHGVVDATTRRIAVVLGDGSVRTAPSRPVGDGRSLAYALALPRTAAVRSVRLGMSGGGSRLVQVAAAPLAVVCATSAGTAGPGFASGGFTLTSPLGALPAVTPVGPVTTIPGSPAIRVADGPGDSLCVAVGDHPFTALGCGVVSPLLSEVTGTYDDLNAPRAFAVVLPARVATLRIAGAGGQGTHDIPTVAATGYTGPYAGHVRFAAATIADFRELSRIEYLDAAGALLFKEDVTASPDDLTVPQSSPPKRIAGRAGRPSLWQTSVSAGEEIVHCLALTAGAAPSPAGACQTARTQRAVLIGVPCASHRLTVAVAVAAGTRVLASTGRSRARRISLHGGAGLLTLPAGGGLRALTFVRKGRRTALRVDAPAGARQCGWTHAPYSAID